MTTTSQNNITMNITDEKQIKQCAQLFDINNNPKILPEKYALSKAELIDCELYYNHTPNKCLSIVAEAKLHVTP